MAVQHSASIIPIDVVKIIADSAGLAGISDDVATLLCQDVEYRLREITQEALKYMKHSKREQLLTSDINNALQLRNIEILYGYGSSETLRFVKVNGCKDLFFTEDKEVDLEAMITQAKISPLPPQVSYTTHWLAVEGVQPDIPQNISKAKRSEVSLKLEAKTENLILEEVEVKPAVRHSLSKELQELYEKLTDVILHREPCAYNAALSALATEPGLHQLLPYFCQFIAKQVAENLQNLPLLDSMMRMMYSMLINPNIHVDHYLHQFIPPILTCLVGKRLCENPGENHWALRDQAAELVAYICHRWGRQYATILPRIVKTLVRAFFDIKKPINTHYGAIVALNKIGSQTRQLVILPNLDRYFKFLRPAMEQGENTIRKAEALMCYHALLSACGQDLYESSKQYRCTETILLQSPCIHLDPIHPTESNTDKGQASSSAPAHLPKSQQSTKLQPMDLQKDLLPISQHYAHLYDLFGESIFTYLTRREYDLAYILVI